jgi:hypothetical protein
MDSDTSSSIEKMKGALSKPGRAPEQPLVSQPLRLRPDLEEHEILKLCGKWQHGLKLTHRFAGLAAKGGSRDLSRLCSPP